MAPETLSQRIEFLLRHTGGTMRVCMLVKDAAEEAAALELLKTKRSKAARLISVRVDQPSK